MSAINGHAFPTTPGRLGDPDCGPAQDPRALEVLRAAMIEMEMGDAYIDDSMARPFVQDELVAMAEAAEEATAGWYDRESPALFRASPEVVHETRHVTAPDGYRVEIEIYRPVDSQDQALPGILYFHGGGMVTGATRNVYYDQWCRDLAALGAVVIQTGFRNAWTAEGLYPFPTGLDDCVAVAEWVHERRGELGLRSVIVQGESGGGNLACAAALRLKNKGAGSVLDGVHASCPFISNAYGWSEDQRLAALPSLVENDGYLMDATSMAANGAIYDPLGEHATDPEAWPYHAEITDLTGLPPHVVVVHELDPLRDEGISYQRKLSAAGVPVVGQMHLGLTHGADFDFRQELPDHYRSAAVGVVTFAQHVG